VETKNDAGGRPGGLEERLALLGHVYSVYDEFTGILTTACRPGCAHCCTCNATLTTLEAAFMFSRLSAGERADLTARLPAALEWPRFQPGITTNQLADICRRDEEPPPEETLPPGSACPLLETGLCTLYPVRPFHCRCMTSRRDCGKTGWADMDPFAVTVNTVFLQYIEHIDADGCSGNLIDVLWFMQTEDGGRRYRSAEPISCPSGLIPNRRVPALMIPPKHRERMAPILQRLTPPT
jgi:hypothetical protein